MNYCASNFRYKKIQKNVLTKNQHYQSTLDTPVDHSKSTINNFSTNTYTGKNYSSIKSLIRRLQAAGNTKINYPRIRNKNERNDIFLRGDSINQIKKIGFFQNPKFPFKKQPLTKKKPSNRSQSNPQSIFKDDEIQQVFISRNVHIQKPKQQVYNIIYPLKTQTQKSVFSKQTQESLYQTNQTPTLKNFNNELLGQNKISKVKDDNFMDKITQKQRFMSLKKSQDVKNSKIQKRKTSTGQVMNIQQNMSQFTIPTYTAQTRRIKVSRSIVKSNSQIKNQPKKQACMSENKKPLFYLSQEQLRQLNITAKSFIVMQYPSKQIITGSYFRQVAQIASLTKIITFYCCLQLIQKYQLNMDEQIITIDQQVQQTTGTSAQLLEGDKFTFRQICYGLMLPSGNDAALAMAKWGGNILNKNKDQIESNLKIFMTFLNATCISIGMKSSYFGNPHGLPHPKSGSTVQDVALIIHEALKIPFFRQVVKTRQYKSWVENNGVMREVIWQNTNKLLRRNGFIGVKTGVTVTAGPCLSTCYETNGKIFIIVLIKTSKLSRRFKQTRKILGKILSKLNTNLYKKQIKQIQKNDAQLDSDNSEDEQQFNYERNDAQQMKRRIKIITYEM